MMIIVSLTDIHGDLSALPQLAPLLAGADAVLLTGDISHFGGASAVLRIVDTVRKYNPRVWAVAGNCDQPEVEAALAMEGISLHGRHAVVDGVALAGAGGSIPCPGRTPGEISEDEFTALLDRAVEGLAPETPIVLAVHQPPYDTACDRVFHSRHVGSRSVRAWIERRKPLVCFTGHIHEGRGTDRIGETFIINPGPMRFGGCGYAALDGGACVSGEIRGLSATA